MVETTVGHIEAASFCRIAASVSLRTAASAAHIWVYVSQTSS